MTSILAVWMIDWLHRRLNDTALAIECAGRTLPLIVRRRGNARRMTLRLAPDGREVRVTLPTWGRSADALAFARSRAAWLSQQLDAVPRPVPPVAGGQIAYRGALLTIVHDPRLERRPMLAGSEIRLGGTIETIANRLRRWLEDEARHLLTADLEDYCARARLALPKLALSRAQRRWGSCAASGAIRINWRLVMAPDPIRRSVVAHEVAHLLHFDHSPRFHAALMSLFEGDLAAAERWLKARGRDLYAPFG